MRNYIDFWFQIAPYEVIEPGSGTQEPRVVSTGTIVLVASDKDDLDDEFFRESASIERGWPGYIVAFDRQDPEQRFCKLDVDNVVFLLRGYDAFEPEFLNPDYPDFIVKRSPRKTWSNGK